MEKSGTYDEIVKVVSRLIYNPKIVQGPKFIFFNNLNPMRFEAKTWASVRV